MIPKAFQQLNLLIESINKLTKSSFFYFSLFENHKIELINKIIIFLINFF